MEIVPTAALALSGAASAPRAPARGRWRPSAFVASALAHSAGGAATLTLLAGAYTAKRRLGIDVFPGLDVLPAPEIEAAIRAAARLFLWWS